MSKIIPETLEFRGVSRNSRVLNTDKHVAAEPTLELQRNDCVSA
jgi:hypothetical protein